MTAEQAQAAERLARDTIEQLQAYLHAQFDGARGPLRDHCFGYSCGAGIAACVAAREALTQLRVSLSQVDAATRQMSASR